MGALKTGDFILCPQCGKSFYCIRSRIKSGRKVCCSIVCASKFTAKRRSAKLRKKNYPFVFGKCEQCHNDIIIKNASFDKKNRRFCSVSCRSSFFNRKRVWKEESRLKLSISTKKRPPRKLTWSERLAVRERNLGSKSHFWKGGLTDQNRKHRNSLMYKNWRERVYQRDDYTCQKCGARNGNGKTVYLNADHIKPWATYPELRFDISNGKTLCLDCHKKTDTFGYKAILNRK